MTHAQLTEIAAAAVGAAQRQLPPEIRPLARGVPVHYERLPAADVIADGFPDDILGLFTGSAHGQELAADNPAPAQILLYVDNLWDYAEDDLEVFRDEVRLTYLHELGHYLGWDEDDLTARGLD
ncbi:MAG: metallopeptidase family protein [Verrucomicrobia bacterium]|nr:metallopeptidase family protein [Verrucomicrobiota bacterium]